MRPAASVSLALLVASGACADERSDKVPKLASQVPPSPTEPAAILGKAGALPLLGVDGRPTTLAAHGAEVTVVAVWASWCAPCVEELPMLQALGEGYRDDPKVSIIALSIDEAKARDRVRQIAAHAHLTIPVLIDGEGAFQKRFMGQEISVPKTFIIDRSFHVLLDDGFVANQTLDAFVRAKRDLIGKALAGAFTEGMPAITHDNPAVHLEDILADIKEGTGASIHVENMDEASLRAFTPELRKMFRQARPKASRKELDRLVEDAKRHIRAGEPVEIGGEAE